MAMENKIVLFKQTGGLYGLSRTRPARQIADLVKRENREGWRAIEIVRLEDPLVFGAFREIVLLLTLLVWTWGPRYMVLLEREASGDDC